MKATVELSGLCLRQPHAERDEERSQVLQPPPAARADARIMKLLSANPMMELFYLRRMMCVAR